jgi:hypothetical protein
MMPHTAFPFVLVPAALGPRVTASGSGWGWLDVRKSKGDELLLVDGFRVRNEYRLPQQELLERGHFLRGADSTSRVGPWYLTSPEAHHLHFAAVTRGLGVEVEALRATVQQGWVSPPADDPMLVICHTPDESDPRWSVWWVSGEGAIPGRFALVHDDDPIRHLADVWPVDELAQASVTVVGVGSIGGSIAESLATAGVGHLSLVDPDRILRHNLPRHRLSEESLGRFKARALAEVIPARYPSTRATPFVFDVAENADLMRPLFARSDLVVCASDGVLSRRVTNHLARRARIPLVLAAVLENGAVGEVVRVQPRTGCLWCMRRTLVEQGVFDPEPSLDRGYGALTAHLPMTAAPPDLRLVAELAAKAAVGTLLERRGYWTQKLPGDWALIGLQPVPGLGAPFDVTGAGDVRWLELPPTRSDCPTCAEP